MAKLSLEERGRLVMQHYTAPWRWLVAETKRARKGTNVIDTPFGRGVSDGFYVVRDEGDIPHADPVFFYDPDYAFDEEYRKGYRIGWDWAHARNSLGDEE